MITSDDSETVADIVLAHPGCAAVFMKHGIDFCCAGDVTVEAACQARELDPGPVRAELEAARRHPGPAPADDPRRMSTRELLARIVGKHHGYLRDVLPALVPLADKVARVHGPRLTALRSLAAAVHDLAEVLGPHLDHEEQILFPALAEGDADSPSVAGELHDMRRDHLQLAGLLERIRDASDDFSVPDWGCRSYRALASELATLDRDLRAHVHLENHVLLPRFLAARDSASNVVSR
jgi:regulator of cell morphogenesis and NO signaling